MHPGRWLDRHLPFPRGRRHFRRWRRTRPFWGGFYLILGGVEIILIPMSPLSILITLGVGGLAALAIGSVLVIAGLCLWFLPAQRHFVSLVALIASVVSFAATNLGGFLLGMALGVLGSSMGFGWKPRKPTAAEGAGPGVGGDDDGAGSTKSGAAAAGPDPGTPAGPPGPAVPAGPAGSPDAAGPPAAAGSTAAGSARAGSAGTAGPGAGPSPGTGRTGPTGAALALPLLLIAATIGTAAPKAHAAGCAGGGECLRPALDAVSAAATVGERPPTVTATYFAPIGFALVEITDLPTRNGPLRVLKLRMGAAQLGDYRLTTNDGSPTYRIGADQLNLNGDVVIYVTWLYGCIEGLICFTFSAEGLPLPPIIPPFVFMTDVKAGQALVDSDIIRAKNLAIETG
ncbi:DUF6114 domain-containing protein [Yinghuangia soli]|uniref:DUF6114 domain-containing protein n=1 Tax=Yinghuangia soli TaxID=2908204 RepID=A0AA41PWM1_9ACTN|nr:DUF6114 domain-containing protein [Yinghuangia soli]MCF2525912.1 DUF6114 domain-containing protein [Yinghuangia soli]